MARYELLYTGALGTNQLGNHIEEWPHFSHLSSFVAVKEGVRMCVYRLVLDWEIEMTLSLT